VLLYALVLVGEILMRAGSADGGRENEALILLPYDSFFSLYILLSFLVIRMDLSRQLYFWFPLALYEQAVSITSAYAELLSRELVSAPRFLVFNFAMLAVLLASFPWVLKFMEKMEHYFAAGSISIWKWGWIPCACFFSMNCLYAATTEYIRLRTAMCLVTFAASALYLVFVIHFCRYFERQSSLRQQLGMTQGLADAEKQRAQEVKEQAERQGVLFQHAEKWLSRLEAAAERKDKEAVRAILTEEQEELAHSTFQRRFCDSMLLDAILCAFDERARKNGIRTEISVRISEPMAFDETDICVLFGNLMENAVEACLALPVNQRWLTMKIEQAAGMDAVILDNSCDPATVRERDGVFYSAKRGGDEPGIGISSIRDVVMKYGGDICFEHSGGVFRVSILGSGTGAFSGRKEK